MKRGDFPDRNAKGEYILYDKGIAVGSASVDRVDGKLVLSSIKGILLHMKEDAKKDGIDLRLNSGFRPWGEQYEIRRKNVIDKTKVDDEEFLITASPSQFSPATGKPGYSNHQDGGAYDFRVKDNPDTKDIDESLAYKWLVDNAIKYGFIRTVESERWHWEFRPGKDMFSVVKKTSPTWDGLV